MCDSKESTLKWWVDHCRMLEADNEQLRADVKRWRRTAERLARELGKVEYAEAAYDDEAVRGE